MTRTRALAQWIARGLVLATAVVAGAGCGDRVFHCADDSDCRNARSAGVCVAPGYCAFEDDACASQLAFGHLAPANLAGTCVDFGAESSSGDVVGTSTPASEDGADGLDDDTTPEASSSTGSTCPQGAACMPADPCALEGRCDADGRCIAIDFVACDEPPSDCHEPIGACGLSGACEYAPRAVGESCTDGDGCTIEDACDGFGACVAGALCPTSDPCQVASCVMDACTLAPLADGTSCGMEAAARCCNGACVDISSDTAHCGGCNTPCADGLDCESISETLSCEIAPEATSGRCRCEFSTAQCPLGQICRTSEPYPDRCVPPASENCDDTRFSVNFCPSYCGYD